MPFNFKSNTSKVFVASALVAASLSSGCTAQKKASTASDVIGGTSKAHEDKAQDTYRYLLATPAGDAQDSKSRCWYSIETPSKVSSSKELWSLIKDLEEAESGSERNEVENDAPQLTQLTKKSVSDAAVQVKINELLSRASSNQSKGAAATGLVGAALAFGAALSVVPALGVPYALVSAGVSYLMTRESSALAQNSSRYPEMFLEVRASQEDIADADKFEENDFLPIVSRALQQTDQVSNKESANRALDCATFPK